ncbi:hypothetical protein [Roseateles violae]|uniref:Uncharacterized protein n=1 Tax=Roseateles violae TaxID=3058042 RepID=A0ABT8DUI5_9BURK|nr:hypothetical protein [Pelomonas sp. PFR6]MDN3921773.1 hypothetical protein [Pelomonas sp. PFR6]
MGLGTSSPVRLYQIAYSNSTLASVDPEYLLLDNLDNQRPDWYEYWAIRRFLISEHLAEDAFYGFFSPKFSSKTGLTHASVTSFVQTHAPNTDVYLFSPQPDMGAFFLNVFEQAEVFDPGFIKAFGAFLEAVGRPTRNLGGMIMDSRQTVFSNYFVARPAFWREWLALNEQLFCICEGPETALQRELTKPTSYAGGAHRKVFMMERTASYLLSTQTHWRSRAADTFRFAWSATRFSEHRGEAILSDALKIAYRDQGFPEYLAEFVNLRERFRASAAERQPINGSVDSIRQEIGA